jgi:predicted ribosome quality control (RQC) complex YloA/Tae2 family protein
MKKKAKLRLIKMGVSRGAYNRTLAQARKNIIKSIYTLILLGYLGLFETTSLEPYVEIANKIQTYTDAYRELLTSKNTSDEHLRIVNMLQNEIEKTLQQLSRPKEMSRK